MKGKVRRVIPYCGQTGMAYIFIKYDYLIYFME